MADPRKAKRKAKRPAVAQSITIKGTIFNILSSTTIQEHIDQGRPQLAKHLSEQSIKRTLGLQKPAGRRVFMSEEFNSGRFSTPRQVG